MHDRNFRLATPEHSIFTYEEWEYLQNDFKRLCFDAGYLTIEPDPNTESIINLKVLNAAMFQTFRNLLKKKTN